MVKSIACALALAASLPAAALTAQPVVKSEIVRFDDLNLASPAGIATLERRIETAVRRVCGVRSSGGSSRIVSKEVSDCMANANAGARQQVALKTGATIRKG